MGKIYHYSNGSLVGLKNPASYTVKLGVCATQYLKAQEQTPFFF
jgi:hypothetical protein